MAYRVRHGAETLAEEGDVEGAKRAYAAHPSALVWRFANQSLWAEVLGELQQTVRAWTNFCFSVGNRGVLGSGAFWHQNVGSPPSVTHTNTLSMKHRTHNTKYHPPQKQNSSSAPIWTWLSSAATPASPLTWAQSRSRPSRRSTCYSQLGTGRWL
jgi:hypothetical protein